VGGCGVPKHREDRLARTGVRPHPGWHDNGIRAKELRLTAAYSGAYPTGACLVAGGKDDATTDDDGASTQSGVTRCSTDA
jgi:hypothetical protein